MTYVDIDCESVGFSGEGRCIEPRVEDSRYCIEHGRKS